MTEADLEEFVRTNIEILFQDIEETLLETMDLVLRIARTALLQVAKRGAAFAGHIDKQQNLSLVQCRLVGSQMLIGESRALKA